MGEKALVEGQISDATELIKKLDEKGNSPTFAAWYFYDDAQEWRLLIAGPAFDAQLPKHEPSAYQIVAEAMKEPAVSTISIADVKLVTSQSSLPTTVGFMIRTPADAFVRAHFTDNYVNGIFLKEMFVLRSAASAVAPAT